MQTAPLAPEQFLHGAHDRLGCDLSDTRLRAEGTAPPAMRRAWPARESALDNNRVICVRIKAKIRCRRAKHRNGRNPARNRDMHRAAVIGDKHVAAINGRRELTQPDMPH